MPIPVFYTPNMVADSLAYFSGAAKPAQVMQSWIEPDYAIDTFGSLSGP